MSSPAGAGLHNRGNINMPTVTVRTGWQPGAAGRGGGGGRVQQGGGPQRPPALHRPGQHRAVVPQGGLGAGRLDTRTQPSPGRPVLTWWLVLINLLQGEASGDWVIATRSLAHCPDQVQRGEDRAGVEDPDLRLVCLAAPTPQVCTSRTCRPAALRCRTRRWRQVRPRRPPSAPSPPPPGTLCCPPPASGSSSSPSASSSAWQTSSKHTFSS